MCSLTESPSWPQNNQGYIAAECCLNPCNLFALISLNQYDQRLILNEKYTVL